MSVADAPEPGHYERKQLLSKDRLIAWSHRRRFETGLRLARPIYEGPSGFPFHDHKGFNWMHARELLGRRFRVERTLGSPVSWLPPHLGSQAWFLARTKS